MIKRIFLIVLDSVGIGAEPDAEQYGDVGSNTLKACFDTGRLVVPNMAKLGLFNIDGNSYEKEESKPQGSFGRLQEKSGGKDTTIGHWEISGIISPTPLPTYPDGFPDEIISEFEKRTGKKVLCNKPYSGTAVIADYGEEHLKTDSLIVYTSADSVFQIAAHEDKVPVEELYRYCEIAREILTGKHGVGRVIARPFTGIHPFARTPRRHDFSLKPPSRTMLTELKGNGFDVISVGKIVDIFAGEGITDYMRTVSNKDGMEKTRELLSRDFNGLCFINLVDFDMLYGHRNDVKGYTDALNEFDRWLEDFMPLLSDDDLLMITADHGCDPSTPSTDHSREYIPLMVYGKEVKNGVNLGTRPQFSDIGKTVCDIFEVNADIKGSSFKSLILK